MSAPSRGHGTMPQRKRGGPRRRWASAAAVPKSASRGGSTSPGRLERIRQQRIALLGEIEGQPRQIPPTLFFRSRLGQQIPLREMTPELAQLLQLLPPLDTLRNDLNVKMPGHGNDGPHDRQVTHIRDQVTHETAIDLEIIHTPALQIRQAGVARPEIVDSDAHAKIAQSGDRVLIGLTGASLTSLEHRTLSKLEL